MRGAIQRRAQGCRALGRGQSAGLTVNGVGHDPRLMSEGILAGELPPRSRGQGRARQLAHSAVDGRQGFGHVIAEQGDADGD